MYAGSTYLPIRAVANLLALQVEYDALNQIVSLLDGEERLLGPDLLTKYEKLAPQYPALDDRSSVVAVLNTNIKILYNNQFQELKDSTGKIIYPLYYNGTNYLPVRAIANLFNINVLWNGTLRVVYLTDDNAQYLETTSPGLFGLGPTHWRTKQGYSINRSIDGDTWTRYVVYENECILLSESADTTASAAFILDRPYKQFSFKLATMYSMNAQLTKYFIPYIIEIFDADTNRWLWALATDDSFKGGWNDVDGPIVFKCDITGVTAIRFKLTFFPEYIDEMTIVIGDYQFK
jgi:hypothetical protein